MKKEIFSNKSDAWFVSRQTNSAFIKYWPAIMGITKWEGCVEFRSALRDTYAGSLPDCQDAGDFIEHYCKQMFGDCPEAEEAYLVYPCGTKHWTWERIDTKLELQQD